MFELSSIIPDLLKNFGKLLPFRFVIIDEYEQGVFFRAGKAVKLCDSNTGIYFPYYHKGFPWIRFERSGLHFHWAWIEDLPTITNVLQVMETQIQTFTTKDDTEITVSFSISYEIFDAKTYWTKIQEFDSSLENFVQGQLATTLSQKTYNQIKTHSSKLCSELQDKISKKVDLPKSKTVRDYRP